MNDTGVQGGERAQVLNLIDYLAAYDAQRTPVVRDVADHRLYRLGGAELPHHEAVRLRPDPETWLSVAFVDLPAPLLAPEPIAHMLTSTRFEADNEPEIVAPPAGVDDAELDDEEAMRLLELEIEWEEMATAARTWIEETWRPWAQEYRQQAAVKRVHRDLFEQRERLLADRDSVELVWGFSRLRWASPEGRVDHPLLTVPAEIEVVEGIEEIRVRAVGAVEVENRFLHGIDLFDRAGHTAIRQSVVEDGLDPWLEPDLIETTTRLVRAIDDEGVVVALGSVPQPHATTDTGWLLLMRRRVPDSQGFLDAMRALYAADESVVPEPLRAIVTAHASEDVASFDDSAVGWSGGGSADPLLLPLTTNEEQQRILRSAQRRAGVTVQGPPGTGKSHTIANLISHYVAYGRRVLVVAEKEQALKVLADKVPAGIRDLTVSVLGADDEGRKRLESAIMNIQTGVAAVDREHADSRIAQLTEDLDGIDRRIASTTTTMLRARRAETDQLPGTWVAGSAPTPQVAADWVARHHERLGYISDEIDAGTAVPITPADMLELVDLINTVGPERADQAAFVLPAVTDLPRADELKQDFDRRRELEILVDRARAAAVRWQETVDSKPEALQDLISQMRHERDWLEQVNQSWKSNLLRQLSEPLLARQWEELQSDLTMARDEAIEVRAELDRHRVELPANPRNDLVQVLSATRQRFATKGKLGLFAGDARRALQECRVNGHTPENAGDVDLCLMALRLDAIRSGLVTRWHNQGGRVGAPSLLGLAEESVGLALADLTEVLQAQSRWRALDRVLETVGARTLAPVPTVDQFDVLISWCADAIAFFDMRDIDARLERLRHLLHDGSSVEFASQLWRQLEEALHLPDLDRWATLRDRAIDLADIAPAALRLRSLRDRLAVAAPLWTREILLDPHSARDAGDLSQAWQWRQLDTWLRGIAALPEPGELQTVLEQLAVERRRTVTDLVVERAWRRLADNLGQRQREALQSYVQAVKRYGKTGGKFAQRWINLMRTALDDSKDAVPVWIMSTSRALSSFTPSRVPPFDVLIIDEASQIGFEALPLLSLAKSAIVVGDDKQTSPENVGLERQQVFDLMNDYLIKIPRYQALFDPDNSLYDLAIQKFAEPIMLTEHFRCLPEIIAFSNTQAYDNRIIPLRDRPPAPGWVPLGLVRVKDGYRKGDINEPEAVQVADLIAGMCGQPEYDGMTFGAISLLGTAQSKRIWDLLYDRLGPEEIEHRKIRCGEAANFQGDERDVIVLSTVVATDPSIPNGRIRGAMTGVRDLRRINVAASRAQNQMWVVTSVDPEMLAPGDLRAALIRHCEDPGTVRTSWDGLVDKCESEFERRVLNDLLARGYRSISVQRQVGRYRLDLVVEGPESRLAIECDGDRWHGEDVWYRDRARQQVLERAGWTFERIRGSSYYRDSNRAMEPVWERLADLGIPTGDEWIVTDRRTTVREVSGASGVAGGQAKSTTEQPADDIEAPAAGSDDSAGDEFVRTAAVQTPARMLAHSVSTDPVDAPIGRHPGHTARANSGSSAKSPASVTIPRPAPIDRPPAIPFGFTAPAITRAMPQSVTIGLATQQLTPYRSWTPRRLVAVGTASSDQIAIGLIDIVSAEGPMHGSAAFETYVHSSGGRRVGTEIQRMLSFAASRALRGGTLRAITDRYSALSDKTLYVPGQEPVQLRALGSRTLYDVPRSEVNVLIEKLGLAQELDDEMVKRTVLSAFGLKSLTAKAKTYLDECRKYDWEIDDDHHGTRG